jgi:hypothetical protein
MELASHKPGMVRELDHFHKAVIGTDPAHDHPLRHEHFLEGVVHLVPVTMTLPDMLCLVRPVRLSSPLDLTGIGAKTHGPSVLFHLLLLDHHVDDVLIGLPEFRAVCVIESAHVPRKLYDGTLQSKTDAQERYSACPDIFNRLNLPFDTPLTKPGGDKQSRNTLEVASIPINIQRAPTCDDTDVVRGPAWTKASVMLL